MKITKQRLVEIIKEELQNLQITDEAVYASDEEEFAAQDAARAEKYNKALELYGVEYKDDGKRTPIYKEGYKQMLVDLEKLGPLGKNVIEILTQVYLFGGPLQMKEIHNMAKSKDIKGLEDVVEREKRRSIPAN
jgi:hypothetical protein